MKRNLMSKVAAGLLASLQFASCTSYHAALPLVHAHRGGAALYPENTVEAMLRAVDLGVPVLELDLHVTRDSVPVVSHDACLSPLKALAPDGSRIMPGAGQGYAIWTMTLDSLQRFNVGSLPVADYPRRVNLPCRVPTLAELVDSVEQHVAAHGLPPVSYNVEIKSDPAKDSVLSPHYRTFADLCVRVLQEKVPADRLLVQCFDVRTLNYLHHRYPGLRLSYLVEGDSLDFDACMRRLDFVPQVFSPESRLLSVDVARRARGMGMELAPWTVDDRTEVGRLQRLGVDAIITNAPDSLMRWLGYPTQPQ